MSFSLSNMTIAGPRAKGLMGARGLYLLWQLDQDLKVLKQTHPETVIIEGEANGIDAAARNFGRENGFRVYPHPVSSEAWAASRGAGYARNKEMVDKSAKVRVYWNGESRGTRHTLTLGFTSGKLERLVLSNGVIWEIGMSNWHPINYGDVMNVNHEYYLALALAERLRKNAVSKLVRNGTAVNVLKLTYANARARDAFNWLCDASNIPTVIRVTEIENEKDYIGWYRFKSKGRAGKFHYTMPGGTECTCEGQHPELVGKAPESRLGPCWHIFAVWLHEYVQQHILPEFHPLDQSVQEQLHEQEERLAA